MRSLLASILRILFKLKFLRKHYYGLYTKYLRPYHLFKGVNKNIRFTKTIKLSLEIEDWIQQNLYLLNAYEEKEIKFLKKTLNNSDTFIDAGAHIGLFTLTASEIVGEKGIIFSFEPLEKNFLSFCHNIKINAKKNIISEQLALSDKTMEAILYLDEKEENSGMATFYPDGYSWSCKVSSIALDDYFSARQMNNLKLIKLDIEGAEYPALIGMKKLLEKYHPILLIEINEEILAKSCYNKITIENFLFSLGYQLRHLDINGEISENRMSNDNSNNYVFITASS